MHETFDQLEWSRTERELGAAGAAEQIRRQPERRASDVREQQRRSARGDDATVDLGDLEIGVDRRIHRDDGRVTAEEVDEGAEVWKHGL